MRVVLLPDSAWPVCGYEKVRVRAGGGDERRTQEKDLDGFLASFEGFPCEGNVVVYLFGDA